MNQALFRILAIGDRSEKGRALEKAVGAVWGHLGYRDIRYNAHITGEEIDVQGTHVISLEKLKGQCKAHAKAIDSPDLRLFYGDVSKARAQGSHVIGAFIALNGYSATSLSWYEELPEAERRTFRLFDGHQFVQHLSEAGMIKTGDSLLESIKPKTQMPVVETWLLFSDRGIFWLLVLDSLDKASRYFTVLSGDGSAVRQHDLEHILQHVELPAKAFRISLQGRESIVKLLLNEPLTIEELSLKAQESSSDLRCVLSSLISDGLLSDNCGHFSLRDEIDGVLSVSRLALGSQIQIDFMKSSYYNRNVRDLILPYVESKYRIELEQDESDVVVKMLLLSPSCLHFVIHDSSASYRLSSSEFERLKLKGDEAARWKKQLRQNLIHNLAQCFARDQVDCSATELMAFHKVVLTKIRFDISVACRDRLFLKLGVGLSMVIAEAGEDVAAGQFVAATGPGISLTQGDALMQLGEFADAMNSYGEVIQKWPRTEEAYAAQHNIAVIHMQKSEFKEAIGLLTQLQDLESEIKIPALANLARCHAFQKDDNSMSLVLQRLIPLLSDQQHEQLSLELRRLAGS